MCAGACLELKFRVCFAAITAPAAAMMLHELWVGGVLRQGLLV
jgi:hypothetical protein